MHDSKSLHAAARLLWRNLSKRCLVGEHYRSVLIGLVLEIGALASLLLKDSGPLVYSFLLIKLELVANFAIAEPIFAPFSSICCTAKKRSHFLFRAAWQVFSLSCEWILRHWVLGWLSLIGALSCMIQIMLSFSPGEGIVGDSQLQSHFLPLGGGTQFVTVWLIFACVEIGTIMGRSN